MDQVNVGEFKNSLGIPREQMPQVARKDVLHFAAHLNDLGYTCRLKNVNIKHILPTQDKFNKSKIYDKLMTIKEEGREVLEKVLILSSEMRLLDGHHNYKALYEDTLDEDYFCVCVTTDIPILGLIDLAKSYDRGYTKDINDEII